MLLSVLRKRIQFNWVRNCLSVEKVTWFLWCKSFGLFKPMFYVWTIGCSCWFYCILVIFLSNNGPLSLISLFVKGWLFISLMENLFLSSGVRHFLMKSFKSSERDLRRDILFLLISSFNCLSLVQAQGAFPWSISYKMTPMDQISFFVV